MANTARLVAYRFRATLARQWGGYVILIVLVGLLGGVSLGALAGARRTQSSYGSYLASTNPTDLQMFTAFDNPALGSPVGYDPATIARLAHVPGVESQSAVVGFDPNIDYLRGVHAHVPPGAKPAVLEGAMGGEYTTQDRAHLVAGRFANPESPSEAVMNAQAATELGIHIGSVVRVALNSDAQEVLLGSPTGPSSLPPARVFSLRLVGIVVFPHDVAQDDYNNLGSAMVLLTPALTHRLAVCCAGYSYSGVTLAPGAHLRSVEGAITRSGVTLAKSGLGGFQTSAPDITAAGRAIRPVSVTLAVFGGLAALALLVVTVQLVDRQLRRQRGDAATLRALGAGQVLTIADSCTGLVVAAVAGSVVAVAVALALSPLFPLGPVRPVLSADVHADVTVLGFGFIALVAGLVGICVLEAYRLDPHRVGRGQHLVHSPTLATRVAGSSSLGVSAATGIRFALEPGERDPVPVRSAILGAALAVLVIVSTVVFGASLNQLVDHPSLYGWNWNYALLSGFAGDEDLPAQQSASLLAHDRHVVAASGVYFVTLDIDGQAVPSIGTSPGARVGPPLLSGHGVQARNQVVLGSSTMAALGVHLGDTVRAGGRGGGKTVRLTVVGTATMPALMGPGMGVGAVIDYHLIPPNVRNTQGNLVPGPNAYLIRTDGPPGRALRSLESVVASINNPNAPSPGSAGGAIALLRPVEIVDSHSLVAIPAVLGAGLAAGAALALGATLVASVRRRRRDLAVLKTLGLSGRQLASVIGWQSSVTVAIGVVIGVPLGIILGHVLWVQFAQAIAAVPEVSVPPDPLTLIVVGAFVLSIVVALIPGRLAGRTRTAVLLRAE